jgi:hypothetical protein
MLRRGGVVPDGGGENNPAVTVTTSSGTGTTEVTTGISVTTDKNGSTVKNGSGITTTVTIAAEKNDSNGNSAVSGGSSADSMSVTDFAGNWQYQVAVDSDVSVCSKDNGTVVIREDGTYTYTDANGYTSTGTVKVGYEEIGGTKNTTVSFYEGSVYKFGGYYLPEKPYEIHLGNGGVSRLVRGDEYISYCGYQNIAYDLIERYYEMLPTLGFRFWDYTDLNDTVTFRIANPYSGFEVQDVEFARISGKGLEMNSMDDVRAYKRTVYSESFANRYPIEDCKVVNSNINSGEYIDETGVADNDLMYYQSYIMYRGNLYANTVSPQKGWIGHVPTIEPIVITDVTSTSFRAYYSCIMGTYESVSANNCNIVDFVIDPSCGEWRINDLTSTDYSTYQSKAAESKY